VIEQLTEVTTACKHDPHAVAIVLLVVACGSSRHGTDVPVAPRESSLDPAFPRIASDGTAVVAPLIVQSRDAYLLTQ
jgi:hypothetical protein